MSRTRRPVSNKLSPIRIFVAHSSKDGRVSKRITESLKQRGFEVWYDEWKIKVGDSITQKISDGLEQGDFLVVVLSRHSVVSRWVQKELSTALWMGMFVLPVRVDDCEIPVLLRDIRYADFRKGFRQGLDELLDAIVTPIPAPESLAPMAPRVRLGRIQIETSPNIRKLVDSFPNITEDEMRSRISRLKLDDKKKVIVEIMDKLSIAEYRELPGLGYLLSGLDKAIRENRRPSGTLFEVLVREFASRSLPFCKDLLLRQVAMYVELNDIREIVRARGLTEWFVYEFENSMTFAMGAINSEIVARLQPILTRDHFRRIVEAALTNNQIYESWGARDHLRRFFALCDRWLTDEQRAKLKMRSLKANTSGLKESLGLDPHRSPKVQPEVSRF